MADISDPSWDRPAVQPPVLRVRDSVADDLPAIQAIYAHHVLHGLASFEETPPDLAEIRRRWESARAGGYPHIAAELDGRLVGYAYGGPYRPRPAYRHTVEGSVYVDAAQPRRGIGRRLLEELIARLTALGFRRMIGVIGDSANSPSIGLHEALGFRRAGHLHAVGFKRGRWLDSIIMERPLGAGDTTLPDPPA